ncbi:unnamed protein product [Linum trigynum]|uniref:Uncharacterized protein n=1 Tax=Linum trigynum TaxID=586398 RepID=A0AAV2EVX6_9ROSI
MTSKQQPTKSRITTSSSNGSERDPPHPRLHAMEESLESLETRQNPLVEQVETLHHKVIDIPKLTTEGFAAGEARNQQHFSVLENLVCTLAT